MSNILIIKHGSLGDIAQASGAIQDISENHTNDQIYLLTTKPYIDLFKKNPFIQEVILDKRLPRYNLIYLYFLMRELKKHNFSKVFDLQNSSRTNFYKNILFPKADKIVWSSSITTLSSDKNKEEFDKISVLERFNYQLKQSGLNTSHTLKPDFSWASTDIFEIKNYYKFDKYILLFPFCSPHLTLKKWPYYNDLIKLISAKFGDEYKIVIAPGPDEINNSKNINALALLDDGKALDISQLTSIIKESSYVVANDTGPAHICSHLDKTGLALFGSHTPAKKVNIGSLNFKTMSVKNLSELKVQDVIEQIKKHLN